MRDERRRNSRRAVALWAVERRGDVVFLCRGVNLSLGGLRLTEPLPSGEGARVRLELRFAGSRGALHVEGDIVETSAAVGTRIRFGRVPVSTRARMLEALVDAG